MSNKAEWFPLPNEIVCEVVRQQEKMGWPEMVPAYAEVPDANGDMRLYGFQELSVGLCEQLVEFHTRRARSWIKRWHNNPAPQSLGGAGKNILYARLYRCRYLTLLGITDSTEADMPFPYLPIGKEPSP